MTVPRITPRKAEVEAIATVLEDPSHESPEAMARAVLAEAARLVLERDLYVVYADAFPGVGWGPYFTETQAKRAWLSDVGPHAGHGRGGGIVPVHPFPEPDPDLRETPRDKCACGHQRWRHTTEGTGRGRSRFYCGSKKEGCRCAGYTDPHRTS